MKTAVITGIRGQDAQYLAELLRSASYLVIGTSHDKSNWADRTRADANALADEVKVVDLSCDKDIVDLIDHTRPDEVFHLASRSSSTQLFDDPIATAEINGLSAVRILQAIKTFSPSTRFCFASSSEVFAGTTQSPQDETTPHAPINAYGAAKSFAMNMVTSYRTHYGLFACSAILYNHESPRRGTQYVTRKISAAVAAIAMGRQTELVLDSLDSRRDWGYAADYANAMWLMLQQASPKDFVIATGETHSVEDVCRIAFRHVGMDYRDFVRVTPNSNRRREFVELRGNPGFAERELGWRRSVTFEQLVCMMVDADIERLKRD